jgi:hypothetical protein
VSVEKVKKRMIEQKEVHLNKYYDLTIQLLDSFVQGNEENINSLLESREECIAAINKLDEEARKILSNPHIQQRLAELMEMEKDIRKHMEASMRRLANQVRFAQNEQYLTKQYDDQSTVSKGIFYDKSK